MTRSLPSGSLSAGVAGAVAATAAVALWVRSRARRAEREHRPVGRLLHVDGVRLHCIERGAGPAVVLLHGNLLTAEDFEVSGLIERLARDHRVIAFDRPGFGHSARPRDREWTPAVQAALLQRACTSLGLDRPVVLGHSLGCSVALSMALDHPGQVGGLVLLGGYFYPTWRLDTLLAVPPAAPLLGDVMRHTVTALAVRATLESLAGTMFAPRPAPADFLPRLSREMLLRPSQLRATFEDGSVMRAQARATAGRHRQLARLPLTLVTGDADKVVDGSAHSVRLHGELPHSRLIELQGVGHMAHHADPQAIVDAVKELQGQLRGGAPAGAALPRTPAAPPRPIAAPPHDPATA